MLTIIVNIEVKKEAEVLSMVPELGKGAAFFDHPKLAYLKQEILFSGTEIKPRQREIMVTEYSLEIETNPSLEKRIRQALS